MEIASDRTLQDADVDNADHIACIKIAEQKKVSSQPRGGKMQFLNIEECFFLKGFGNISLSKIEQDSSI